MRPRTPGGPGRPISPWKYRNQGSYCLVFLHTILSLHTQLLGRSTWNRLPFSLSQSLAALICLPWDLKNTPLLLSAPCVTSKPSILQTLGRKDTYTGGTRPSHKQPEVFFSPGKNIGISAVSGPLKVRGKQWGKRSEALLRLSRSPHSWCFQDASGELLPGIRGWGNVGLTL